MAEKVETLRRLLREGYEVEDVASDHGAVEARLRRGPSRVTLRLFPSEADALLRDPRRLR
ncbi:MAG TPA: hypothetical protein VNX21_05685 [Candidatus Thermoplasmatota archaeon]|nr:hypothetical protein [Candidatus Thermoplasmatota archaeon]